jgi:hypothetical protein
MRRSKKILMSALAGLLSSSNFALGGSACEEIVAGLERLDLDKATDLKPSGRLTTYQALYAECDAKNTFDGRAVEEDCSDKNNVVFVKRFPDGTIVFNAQAAVNTSGRPKVIPNACRALEHSEAALTFDKGSKARHANAENLAFIAVPSASPSGISFIRDAGISPELGDLMVAVAGSQCSFGVVADEGASNKLGEASLKAQGDLGNPQCKATEYPCTCLKGDDSEGEGIEAGVIYVVFPKTRPKPLLSQTVEAVATAKAGERMLKFLADYGR